MNTKSELDCYLYYMWNVWSRSISIGIFGEMRGAHLWEKWEIACESCGADGAPALFYSMLDSNARREIVEKSITHYN